MDIATMINKEIVCIGAEAKTCEEALIFCSDLLKEKGYVKESFCEALLAREKEYPTGLPMPYACVAIPHCDPQHIIKPGIAVVILKHPVDFRSMEDPEQTVPVEFIFCLSVEHGEDQVRLLPKIVSLFLKEENIKKVQAMKTPEEVEQYLRSTIVN